MASILIVDDDAEGAEPVVRFLRRAGHRVMWAPNGREALALLTGALPDLIISDVRMPEMDGVTFLQVLRSYLRWQDLPVVMLTAYPEGLHAQDAGQPNAPELFLKSNLKLDELLASVERHLRARGAAGSGPAAGRPPDPAAGA